MFTRIQWRIAASYVALIVVLLSTLGVYLALSLRARQLTNLEGDLLRQARIVADDGLGHLTFEGSPSLGPLAIALGRDSAARVTFIAPDGTVWGDSDQNPALMENHANRPEVLQALAQGRGETQRHSATLDKDLLYVAVPMQRNGTVLGIARVALPVKEIDEGVNEIIVAMATALALAAAISIVVAVLVARATAGPISTLTEATRRLAGGDLTQTIRVQVRDEVSLLGQAFNEMAISLRTHIADVESQRAHLTAILTHMADGLIIADRDGTVRLLNPAAARLLQVEPSWAEGRSLVSVVRDHELATLVTAELADREPDLDPCLIELGARSGGRFVQARVSRVPGPDGAIRQVLLILQDVTDLRRLETVRREFVANVSHDLRTPVAGLKALVETLEDGAIEDPEPAREFLGRMRIEVDGLAQLVEELLELSRIESGQIPLQIRPTDPKPFLAAAVERLRPLAQRQGVQLTIGSMEDLPPVQADAERIQQVVINLVHNAVKFTQPGGSVTVSADTHDGELLVRVTDTGAGIEAEALPRLFERFYKADKARVSGEGTGLGLAIAKHLVQAHDGRIWAESPGEGKGSTFIFTLPLAPLPIA